MNGYVTRAAWESEISLAKERRFEDWWFYGRVIKKRLAH